MSITNTLVAEEMQVHSNKEYRMAVKARLKELIMEGDESAIREYDRLFPKAQWNIREKEEKQYESRVLGRRVNRIPFIICKTCGKVTDHVMEYQDPHLIRESRKTWKRIIKPTLSYFIYMSGRKRRNRRLFFSYKILGCLKNKHKLQLKFKEHRTLVEMGYDYQRSKA